MYQEMKTHCGTQSFTINVQYLLSLELKLNRLNQLENNEKEIKIRNMIYKQYFGNSKRKK